MYPLQHPSCHYNLLPHQPGDWGTQAPTLLVRAHSAVWITEQIGIAALLLALAATAALQHKSWAQLLFVSVSGWRMQVILLSHILVW